MYKQSKEQTTCKYKGEVCRVLPKVRQGTGKDSSFIHQAVFLRITYCLKTQ
jgi:hypothetical protein